MKRRTHGSTFGGFGALWALRAGLEPGGPRVCAAGGFGGGGGEGGFGGVAGAEEDFFGAIFFGVEDGDGLAEGAHAEIFFAFGAVDSVHESGDVEQLGASVHEVKVENLLTCHTLSRGRILA